MDKEGIAVGVGTAIKKLVEEAESKLKAILLER